MSMRAPRIEQLESRQLLCTYHMSAALFDVQQASSAALRVDSAGPSPFTDSNADVWAADAGYVGGSLATSAFAVGGTNDDPLYYTARYGKSFSYSLAVPNGQYTLTLLFAETYAPNQRKFDVSAEGALILNDIDLAAAHGSRVAIQRSFDVNIADGKLDLQFTGVLGNATIAGIQLVDSDGNPPPSPPPPPPPPPPPSGEAPAAPGTLRATGISSSQAQLTWDDNSDDETLFKIERKTGSGSFVQVATAPADATSFVDDELTSGTKYIYRIRAANNLNSAYSNEDSATMLAGALSWKTVASSPILRAEALGATVNKKLYVFGGLQVNSSNKIIAIKRSDKYDPTTNKWTRIADMPQAITHAGIAVDGNTIWCIGGYLGDHPGPGISTVYKYNTTNNTWSTGPNLPEKRGAGAAAIVGRELHFFGGMNESRTQDEGEHWMLDLDNTSAGWKSRAPLTNPRNHTSAAAINGKIYCIGGQHDQEENQDPQDDVDRYDPASDTWTKVASLPSARSHTNASTFVMNGKILVVGGENGSGQVQRTVYSYDPNTNAWSTIGLLPAARSTSVAGVIGTNQFISATGNDPNPTTTTWVGTLS